MTIQHITPASLSYKGALIAQRDEMLSLTDMWSAGGRDDAKRPANWTRKEGATFIEYAEVALNVPRGHIIRAGRGRYGETFAHWQIALAYAKYLSPEFHMWCNTVVRERMEGRSISTAALPPDVLEILRRTDGISRMLSHKVTEMEKVVGLIASVVQPPHGAIHRSGKTAGQIWRTAGFPKMKVTSWFSNRLCEMGCQVEGALRGELGLGTAKLFDPDKADLWLRNGGRNLVEDYISRRIGQKVLRLVPPVEVRT